MKTYKIKHVDSGLYYQPNYRKKIDNKYVKCNLGKTGKVYNKRPTLKHIEFYNDVYGRLIKRVEDEFEIVQYNTTIEKLDKIRVFVYDCPLDKDNYEIDLKNGIVRLKPFKGTTQTCYDSGLLYYLCKFACKI